jgi:hypothetical protein
MTRWNRRQLLVRGGAGGAAAVAAAGGYRAAKGDTPAPGRAQGEPLFTRDPDHVNLTTFILASHPRPVREAIERHRRALDRARRARSRRKVSLVLRGTATDGAGNAASRRTTLRLPRR